MDNKAEKLNLADILKSLSHYKIKKNNNKVDLKDENPGWKESEDEYRKAQTAWMRNLKNKK